MCADLTFWQADSLDDGLKFGELERVDIQTPCYLTDHGVVLWRTCRGIPFECLLWYGDVVRCVGVIKHCLVLAACLKITDNTARYELELVLRGREVDERACPDKRWAGYAHMHLPGSEIF